MTFFWRQSGGRARDSPGGSGNVWGWVPPARGRRWEKKGSETGMGMKVGTGMDTGTRTGMQKGTQKGTGNLIGSE